MPIVPNLAMPGSPAMPTAPAMERGGGVRVNANDALRGLGRVADSLAGMTPVPGVPDDLGQGRARGMAAIGQGVRDLGQARMEIEARRAEARNYVELSKASLEMEREMAEFQKFQETNPDPSTWVDEWNRRMTEWPGRYMEGRDYPPALKDAINARVMTRGQQFGMDVDVAATKATVALARESLLAEVAVAEDGGRLDEASALLRAGVEKGWIRADVAAERELQAQSKIEQRTLADALDYADAFAMRGDMPNAFGALDAVRELLPAGEYEARRARLETVNAAAVEEDQAKELAMTQGARAAAASLNETNEDGTPKNFPHLKGTRRLEMAQRLWEIDLEQKRGIAATVREGIDNGAFTSMDQVEAAFADHSLTDIERATFRDLIEGQFVKDEGYIQSAFTAAASYDPASDPTGERAASLAAEWSVVFGDDPRLEKVNGVLEKRRRGESLTMAENMRAAKTKEMLAVRESEGAWLRPATAIKKAKTPEGVEVYVDTEADIKEGDPGYISDPNGIFGRAIKGKIVRLSQEDKIRVREGKEGNVTDLDAKNRAAAEDATILDALEQDADSGKIQDETQWDARYQSLALPIKDRAASVILESSLFPPSIPEEEAPPSPTPMISISNTDAEKQLRFMKRLGVSIPSRVEDTLSLAVDPVGALESASSLYDSVKKSIESGTSISDVKNAIAKSLSSPEAMADFYVDAISLLLTRNPKFSDTNIDEMAIATLAAQNAPGSDTPDPGYIPGAILLAALNRANKRVSDENERDFGKPRTKPSSSVKEEQVKGAVIGPKKSAKPKD